MIPVTFIDQTVFTFHRIAPFLSAAPCLHTHSVSAVTRSDPSVSPITCLFSVTGNWLLGCILSGRRQFCEGDAMTNWKLSNLAIVTGIVVLLAARALGQITTVPVVPQVVVKEQVPAAA